jgi:hypothetical protein
MGDPFGVNNLTTKLMIENRQSTEKNCSESHQTVPFFAGAMPTRRARAAHADRVSQKSAIL